MFCKYCGNKTSGDSRFCTKCGKQLSGSIHNNLENNQVQDKKQVHKWSWGAFFLPLIYLISMEAGTGLILLFLVLSFIPGVNFIVWFYLGFKGREIAWKKRKWESYEDYVSVQKSWDIAGIIVFAIFFLWGFLEAF